MKYILLLLFSTFLLSTYAINPFIKNYNIADGLPSSKTFGLFQDSQNFMWIGTDVGVVRFDGNNMVHYKTSDGLSDNITIRIKEDKLGRIWFINLNGTVNYFYKNQIFNSKNAPFLDELKSDFYFINFFEDTDSTLYFYNSTSEVYVIKNDKLIDYQRFNLPGNLENTQLNLFDKSSDGEIVLWTSSGISKLKKLEDNFNVQVHKDLLYKAFKVNTDHYIVLDQFGFLHAYKNDKLQKEKFLNTETIFINDLLIDDDGLTWLANYHKGVYCYKNDSLLLHLDIELAQSINIDLENNIWISSERNGVYKINRNILNYTFLETNNFEGKGIVGLAKGNNGEIFATNGSSLYLIQDNNLYKSELNIERQILRNIQQLENNNVMLSGLGTGSFLLQNFKINKRLNKLQFDSLIQLNYRIKDLVVDTQKQLVYSYLNDKFISISYSDDAFRSSTYNLHKGRINSLFQTNRGDLIVNTTSNYALFTDSLEFGRLRLGDLKILKALNGKTISSHLKLDGNNEVFNVLGNELYLLNDTTLYEITKNIKTQIDYRIINLAFDGSTLFFFTSNYIYFISNPLDIIDDKALKVGRLDMEFNNITTIVCENNLLYIGTNDGLISIPIEDCVGSKTMAPEPYFDKIYIDNESYNMNLGPVVFKNKKSLVIEFASLNYSALPSNYSYQLEGVDESWTQGKETRVAYLNLQPGKYSFKLKARKGSEDYSNETTLPIIVKPTIFQRAITKILFGAISLFIISLIPWTLYKYQMKNKETENTLITLEHKALQSMMNPHFIFNALGSIQRYLLLNKSEEAGTYLSQFARLIRQNMNSLKSNYINIDDEVERLRNYLDLEKFRMNDKFNYSIHIDNEIDGDDIRIPSMVVQPFVENAIWHGVSLIPEQGEINVKFFYENDNCIKIVVEDNGVGIQNSESFSKSDQNLNMGVSITKKRLKLIGERFHVKSEIVSEEVLPGEQYPGTRIILMVPILS